MLQEDALRLEENVIAIGGLQNYLEKTYKTEAHFFVLGHERILMLAARRR